MGLKFPTGFTRYWPSIGNLACMDASVYLLALSVGELGVGTAYAVWTGNGAVGTFILGMRVFGEPRSVGRLLWIKLIAAGIVGQNVTFSPEKPSAAPPSRADASQ